MKEEAAGVPAEGMWSDCRRGDHDKCLYDGTPMACSCACHPAPKHDADTPEREVFEWLQWADGLTGNKHYLASKMRREITERLNALSPPTPQAAAEVPADRKVKVSFHCRVCGRPTDIAPDPPARAICPACCEDHDYRYERDLRGHYCFHCGEEAPLDYLED